MSHIDLAIQLLSVTINTAFEFWSSLGWSSRPIRRRSWRKFGWSWVWERFCSNMGWPNTSFYLSCTQSFQKNVRTVHWNKPWLSHPLSFRVVRRCDICGYQKRCYITTEPTRPWQVQDWNLRLHSQPSLKLSFTFKKIVSYFARTIIQISTLWSVKFIHVILYLKIRFLLLGKHTASLLQRLTG